MALSTESAARLEILDGVALLTLDQPGSRANTLGQAILAEASRQPILMSILRRLRNISALYVAQSLRRQLRFCPPRPCRPAAGRPPRSRRSGPASSCS